MVKDVVHYGMDTSEIDHVPIGKYECFDGIAVECDTNLIERVLQIVDLPLARCASADKFVADPKQKSALNSDFGAEICDMESAGVLFTCKFNGVPCLMVKCVSDSLIGGANEYEKKLHKGGKQLFCIGCSHCRRIGLGKLLCEG